MENGSGNSGLKLAMCALASGMKVFIEAEEPSVVIETLVASGILSVQWARLDTDHELRRQLLREGRWTVPDAWLVAGDELSLVARVRAIRERQGRVPLVALSTGVHHPEVATLAAGADGLCRWPQDADLLAYRVHALLRRASGTFKRQGPRRLELLIREKQLRVNDQVVQLSLLEYVLLSRLDSSRNEWVPSDELWSALGSNGATRNDSSLIRMHVLRVRRKLGAQSWALRTERGRGTMLTDLDEDQIGADKET